MIVIGKQTKSGDFNGRPWQKTYLYCSEPIPAGEGEGEKTSYVKCKPDVCTNIEVGDDIKVYYDEYGNPDFIQVL